jgi:hypothetical protein
MKADRISNTDKDRIEKQARGIALMKSGSYVAPDFDAKEYHAFTRLNRSTVDFDETQYAVIARGPLGSLGRLAQISKDQKYAQYADKSFISLALISAEVFAIPDFIRLLLQNEAITVQTSDRRMLTGLLYGSIKKQYSTLWYVINNRLVSKDVEKTRNDKNARELVKIVETDLARADEVRKLMQSIL